MNDLHLAPSASGNHYHLVLAHGAGAGLKNDFMQRMQTLLAAQGINTWLFNFGYMQKAYAQDKKIPPSRLPALINEYHAVIDVIKQQHMQDAAKPPQIWLGGKSMGGRVACHVAAERCDINGLAVLGYPFHPIGKPDTLRLDILQALTLPMVICQGERDAFGNRAEVQGYELQANIDVNFLADGDHSLQPRKASGLSQDAHLAAAAEHIARFIRAHS